MWVCVCMCYRSIPSHSLLIAEEAARGGGAAARARVRVRRGAAEARRAALGARRRAPLQDLLLTTPQRQISRGTRNVCTVQSPTITLYTYIVFYTT